MKIEHKLEPIEHWIVDGKAYRLATEADVGKECYFSDAMLSRLRSGIERCLFGKLTRFNPDSTDKYWSGGTCWLFALIQDDSLLTLQRTPVPSLGDGWFLLTDDEVLRDGDKVSSAGIDVDGSTWPETVCEGQTVRMWRRNNPNFFCARYFGSTKEPEQATEIDQQPKPIDWTKPVRTKDGRAVRVLCTDGPGESPVIGIVDGCDGPENWMIDGTWAKGEVSDIDLENAPQRIQREYWVNVYPDNPLLCSYTSREKADMNAGIDRFACVKITIDCEEGEGL